MNDVAKGYQRDSRIVAEIQEMKALTTEQVRYLYFRGLRYGLRKAQERLLKLVREGRLKRVRVGAEFAYYVERPGQLDHAVAVNWCRVFLEICFSLQDRFVAWEQPDYSFMRPDGLFVSENVVTGETRGWFVEADLSDGNRFDKVELYTELFESGAYEKEWWVERMQRFPQILIATVRETAVKRTVKEGNAAGLRFTVKSFELIRKEIREGDGCYASPRNQEGRAPGGRHLGGGLRGDGVPAGAGAAGDSERCEAYRHRLLRGNVSSSVRNGHIAGSGIRGAISQASGVGDTGREQ